jgi:hypothetical protein
MNIGMQYSKSKIREDDAVFAFRQFKITEKGFLAPLFADHDPWYKLSRECKRCGMSSGFISYKHRKDHERIPQRRCACGFYSLMTQDVAERGIAGCSWSQYGIARVKIWGHVVTHELGYRSQFMEVVSVFYHDSRVREQLRKNYGRAVVRVRVGEI